MLFARNIDQDGSLAEWGPFKLSLLGLPELRSGTLEARRCFFEHSFIEPGQPGQVYCLWSMYDRIVYSMFLGHIYIYTLEYDNNILLLNKLYSSILLSFLGPHAYPPDWLKMAKSTWYVMVEQIHLRDTWQSVAWNIPESDSLLDRCQDGPEIPEEGRYVDPYSAL